jgi:hypothetical protein
MITLFTQVVDLGMAVVARRNTVIGLGVQDLICLEPAVGTTFIRIPGLEETAAAAATVVVGLVGMHLNKIFLTYNRFDDKPQIFRNGISITFAHDLARVLNRKLDL